MLTRLRIAHTWHTHKHLVNRTEPDPFITCGTEVIVKHTLLECRKLKRKRIKVNLLLNFSIMNHSTSKIHKNSSKPPTSMKPLRKKIHLSNIFFISKFSLNFFRMLNMTPNFGQRPS